MDSNFDIEAYRNRLKQEWEMVADGWNRWSGKVGEWTRDETMEMLERAGVSAGSKVLDLAAGDGEQSFIAARRVGADGHVLITDISENLIRIAQALAEQQGLSHIDARVMDAEQLDLPDNSVDAVICRNGLMLFADPLRALREVYRVLRPGGKFAALVFSAPEKNTWLAIPGKIAMEAASLPPPAPGQPGLFSLSQPQRFTAVLQEAGFTNVEITSHSGMITLGPEESIVSFLKEAAGALQMILSRLPDDVQQMTWNKIGGALSQFSNDTGFASPVESLIGSGTKL